MECLRLALGVAGEVKGHNLIDWTCAAQNVCTLATKMYEFALADLTADDLDTAPASVPKGADPDAVIARNALINTPLRDIAGLPAELVRTQETIGFTNLGRLVQVKPVAASPSCERLQAALAPYGLRLGMTQDDLREWVLRGPQA